MAPNCKSKLFPIFLALCACIFLFTIFISTKSAKPFLDTKVQNFEFLRCELQFPLVFNRLIAGYRNCVLTRANKTDLNMWGELTGISSQCMDKFFWNSLNIRNFQTKDDDLKRMVTPWLPESFPCVHVTLGVGDDIAAEEQMRRLLPNCTFFGADPIRKSGEIFQKIGTYFQIAVGANSGVVRNSVLDGGYVFRDVQTIDFLEFLTRRVNATRLDSLWMDNEGAEYDLLRKYFVDDGNVTVCQASIEIHGDLEKYGMNKTSYNNLVLSIFQRSSFIPLWVQFIYGHTRTYFANVSDPYCLETVFLHKFC